MIIQHKCLPYSTELLLFICLKIRVLHNNFLSFVVKCIFSFLDSTNLTFIKLQQKRNNFVNVVVSVKIQIIKQAHDD